MRCGKCRVLLQWKGLLSQDAYFTWWFVKSEGQGHPVPPEQAVGGPHRTPRSSRTGMPPHTQPTPKPGSAFSETHTLGVFALRPSFKMQIPVGRLTLLTSSC